MGNEQREKMLPKCPICRADFLSNESFKFDTYSIETCSNCLVRVSSPLVSNIGAYTEEIINTKEEYFESSNLGHDHVQHLKKYLDVENKKVLDIGCAAGAFLDTMKKSNDVFGIELNSSYSGYLTKKGIPHKIGSLEECLNDLPDDSFDLITLWDVFEHFQDPRDSLESIRKKLAANGIIIIWTNNYDDYINRFAEATYKLTAGKLKTFMDQSFNRTSGHNFNFTESSLTGLYEELGFTVMDRVITDTPSKRLTKSVLFKIALDVFYIFNRLSKKGKIICHVLTVRVT